MAGQLIYTSRHHSNCTGRNQLLKGRKVYVEEKSKSMLLGMTGASVPKSSPRLLLKTPCSVCMADVSPVRTDATGAAAAAG